MTERVSHEDATEMQLKFLQSKRRSSSVVHPIPSPLKLVRIRNYLSIFNYPFRRRGMRVPSNGILAHPGGEPTDGILKTRGPHRLRRCSLRHTEAGSCCPVLGYSSAFRFSRLHRREMTLFYLLPLLRAPVQRPFREPPALNNDTAVRRSRFAREPTSPVPLRRIPQPRCDSAGLPLFARKLLAPEWPVVFARNETSCFARNDRSFTSEPRRIGTRSDSVPRG